MALPPFVSLSVNVHLRCFYSLAIINNPVINSHIWTFVWMCSFLLYLGVLLLGRRITVCLTFLRNCQTNVLINTNTLYQYLCFQLKPS